MGRTLHMVAITDMADYLILRGQYDGSPMTPAKLQKMLYYVQAWNLAYGLGPVFPEEPEAWVNGPVYRDIYSRYSLKMMYEPIKDAQAKNAKEVGDRMEAVLRKMKLGDDREETTGAVVNAYGMKSTERLITLTHQEAPWVNARKGLGPLERSTKKISHKSMREYYAKRLQEE